MENTVQTEALGRERVEVGADGCGCPITGEMDVVDGELRGDVGGSDRTEHRPDCWAAEPAAEATPEHRTVSLEVLTPELRALSADVAEDDRVGIVLRVNGEAVAVAETERDWTWRHGEPTKVLADLLTSMEVHGGHYDMVQPRAELLMPGADVLAALVDDVLPAMPTYPDEPDRSPAAVARELRILANIIEAHPDFPIQSYGLSVGQATDVIGGEAAVRRIAELLGLPVDEHQRADGRRSWRVARYGALALHWSHVEDVAP